MRQSQGNPSPQLGNGEFQAWRTAHFPQEAFRVASAPLPTPSLCLAAGDGACAPWAHCKGGQHRVFQRGGPPAVSAQAIFPRVLWSHIASSL